MGHRDPCRPDRAQWHAGAAAAATAIAEARYDETKGSKTFVTGLEYAKEVQPMIVSGAVSATSYASIADMGYTVVELAAKHLKGEAVPQVVSIQPHIVTKDNVDQFVPEM